MCIIDQRDDWFGDCTDHSHVVWIEDIRGLTLRQAICKLFNTTSGDIKNSPGLYGICGESIQDFSQIIDDTFIRKHITKKFKKSKSDELFKPDHLTMDEYTFCSGYRLIVEFDPKEN